MPFNVKYKNLQNNLQIIPKKIQFFCKQMQTLMLDSFKNCSQNTHLRKEKTHALQIKTK